MEEQFPILTTKSDYELWKLFFSDEILGLILQQTELYANRDRNDMSFHFDKTDLLNFLGILLISGYHSIPSEVHYCSNQPGLQVNIVAETMSRDRFQHIKRNLHLADNQYLTPGDKAAKVNSIYKTLNKNTQQFGIFHTQLSIDESMVPYHGRSSMKMFIKGKPIRYGYKLWTLAGEDGHPYCLIIYQGKSEGKPTVPLGTKVVNMLLEPIIRISNPRDHFIFMNNFSTSYNLLSNPGTNKFGLQDPTRTC